MTPRLRARLRPEDAAGIGFEMQGAHLGAIGLGAEAEAGRNGKTGLSKAREIGGFRTKTRRVDSFGSGEWNDQIYLPGRLP
jgi:hypothetical protein